MGLLQELQARADRIVMAAQGVAADIAALKAHVSGGVSAADVAAVLARLDGMVQRMETLDASYPERQTQGDSPITRNEHPRIWVTRDTLPAIRARLASGGALHEEAKWWVKLVDDYLDAPFASKFYWHGDVALAYLLARDGPIDGVTFRRPAIAYGEWAKAAAIEGINAISVSDDEMAVYPRLLDWLWPLFTAEERAAYGARLKTSDLKQDAGSPWVVQHAAIRGVRMFAAIALHGAGIDDTWAATRLAEAREAFRGPRGVTSSESALGAGIDAGNGQGLAYAWGHTLRNVLLFEEGYRTAFNIPEAIHYGTAATDFFRLQPRHLAYRLLPAGKKWFVEKGHYNGALELAPSGATLLSATFDAIAHIYRDIDPDAASLASWAIQTHLGRLYEHHNNVMQHQFSFFRLLRGADTLPPPKSPAELGLPLTIGGGNYERVIWKSSWGADDVSVHVHVNKWGRNFFMNPPWPGSFQIFRNGPQVINQWGAPGGHEGSWLSGNMLMFPHDAEQPTSDRADFGGHRGSANPGGMDGFVSGGPADERDALLLASGLGWEALYVDHTRAYRNTRTGGADPHVESVERQIVYLRGGPSVILVIRDRYTTAADDIGARWLMHTSAEPKIESDGRVCADNATYPGRTCVTVVSPAATAQVRSGSWTPYRKLGEFTQPPYSATAALMPWVPNWTIDIQPSGPRTSRSGEFIVVVEVGDLGAASTPVTNLGPASVRVGSRTVTFSATGAEVQ